MSAGCLAGSSRFGVRLALGLILLATGTQAGAQSAPGDGSASGGASGITVRESMRSTPSAIRRALSLQLARNAIFRLRSVEDPGEREHTLVGLTLDVANAVHPESIELARLRVEAWTAARNKDRTLAATRDVIALDPRDTVAQLRLISSRLDAKQDAESRLALYDRFLSSGGGSLDASVRSRLALDSALLLRERGDQDGYLERLTLATQLDPSNKDAAVLAASHVLDRSDDALGRVEMLLNVVMADPLDASSHLNLARELRSHGAFAGAMRFQELGMGLLFRTAGGLSDEIRQEALIGLWQKDGVDSLLETIEQIESSQRSMRAQQIAMAEAAGQPTGAPLEQHRLQPDLEMLRLAAHLSVGRREAAAASMRSLRASTEQVLTTLRNPPAELLARGLTPESIEESIRHTTLRLIWLSVWSGENLDEAASKLEEMAEKGVLRRSALQRFRGWMAIRRGEHDVARGLLEPLAESDPQALLGLAVLAEREGAQQEAVRRYAQVAMRQSGLMTGAFARGRIESLLGESLRPTPTATALERYIERTPRWLDEMTYDPRSFISLSIAHVPPRTEPVDGLFVRVRLRNVGRLPLALGPEKPIESRILLSPQASLDGQEYRGYMLPEVVDLNRRLRLMPGEAIEANVWVGQGAVGLLVDSVAHFSLTMRWRALQGFRYNQQGHYVQGPNSLSADSDLMTRSSLRPLAGGAGAVAQAMQEAQGSMLINSLFHTRGLILSSQQVEGEARAQMRADALILMRAVAERVATMSAAERALALMLVGTTLSITERGPIDEALEGDTHPVVIAAMLIGRVPPPTDGLYRTAMNAADATVAEMARLTRELVSEGMPQEAIDSDFEEVVPGPRDMTK